MFSKIFLLLSAVVFFLIGTNTFVDPQKAVAGLELSLSSVTAFNEIRANYGGMHLGMGLLVLMALFQPKYRVAGVWLVLIFTAGLLLGRAVSIYIDGLPNDIMMKIIGFETISVIFAQLALLFDAKKSRKIKF